MDYENETSRSQSELAAACAFTGHRPQKLPWGYDEGDRRCAALKAELWQWLVWLADQGVTNFLSGMAEGADTWAAESVLDLRAAMPALKLHCILPCTSQADQWRPASQERYYRILEQADSIVYVNREPVKNCMLIRNRFLVDHAHYLLAIYNGEQRGGTAAAIRYARKLKREVLIADCGLR